MGFEIPIIYLTLAAMGYVLGERGDKIWFAVLVLVIALGLAGGFVFAGVVYVSGLFAGKVFEAARSGAD